MSRLLVLDVDPCGHASRPCLVDLVCRAKRYPSYRRRRLNGRAHHFVDRCDEGRRCPNDASPVFTIPDDPPEENGATSWLRVAPNAPIDLRGSFPLSKRGDQIPSLSGQQPGFSTSFAIVSIPPCLPMHRTELLGLLTATSSTWTRNPWSRVAVGRSRTEAGRKQRDHHRSGSLAHAWRTQAL